MGAESFEEAFDRAYRSNPAFRTLMQQLMKEQATRPGKRGQITPGLDIGELFPPDQGIVQVCELPFTAIVTGHRGGGKSATCLRMQELLRHKADPYAVGLPSDALKHLPTNYGIVESIEEFPRGCVVYIPEAYRMFNARGSGLRQGLLVGELFNLARHRDQTLIVEVQNPAQLDRNIISEADMILIKEPPPLSQGFERPQLRKYMDEARGLFSAMKRSRRRRAVFVAAPGQEADRKIFETKLPTYWSDALSKIFSRSRPGGGMEKPVTRKAPSRRSAEEVAKRKARANEMDKAGFSRSEIADALAISKTQAHRYCTE